MNQIRLNAGRWRSRVLKFPDAEGLRPTPDRVRQTLFNWLGQDLTGKVCLDLFAGTGALGFEAISRNATQVVMLELGKVPYQTLIQNQHILQAIQADIRQIDAMRFLAESRQRFDLIFCDPPYRKHWLERLMPLLANHLKENGLLYVEAEYALKSDPDWNVIKSGKAGQVFYHLLQVADQDVSAQP